MKMSITGSTICFEDTETSIKRLQNYCKWAKTLTASRAHERFNEIHIFPLVMLCMLKGNTTYAKHKNMRYGYDTEHSSSRVKNAFMYAQITRIKQLVYINYNTKQHINNNSVKNKRRYQEKANKRTTHSINTIKSQPNNIFLTEKLSLASRNRVGVGVGRSQSKTQCSTMNV